MSESSTAPSDLLEAGHAALEQGAWRLAVERFDSALAVEDSPEAYEGRALAAWWLEDGEAVIASRHEAYRLFLERGDDRSAARVAMRLAEAYGIFRGDISVVRGWLARAERLLDGQPPSPELALLTMFKAGMAGYGGDRAEARRLAREAGAIARATGAADIGVYALAIEGRALVAEGDVGAGMALLDEATAAATSGEIADLEVVPGVCCVMITACERVRDFDRAAGWCDSVQTLCADYMSDSLFAYCRTSYAGALTWWGSWEEAATELEAAIGTTRVTRPPLVSDPIRRLAELRLRQGRLEDARALLAEIEGNPAGALARAALALEEGRANDALELADRFLRSIPEGSPIERLAGLETKLAATLAAGDLDAAGSAAGELRSIAEAVGTEPLRAASRLAEGCVAAALGDHALARPALEDAADLFGRSRAPFEAAKARACLGETLAALGRADAGAAELRAARESFEGLGAAREADRLERQLVELEGSPDPAAQARTVLTQREAQVLRLVADGKNDKEIAAELVLSEHTVHRHVSNIRTKLGVSSRAAAAALAARQNLI